MITENIIYFPEKYFLVSWTFFFTKSSYFLTNKRGLIISYLLQNQVILRQTNGGLV